MGLKNLKFFLFLFESSGTQNINQLHLFSSILLLSNRILIALSCLVLLYIAKQSRNPTFKKHFSNAFDGASCPIILLVVQYLCFLKFVEIPFGMFLSIVIGTNLFCISLFFRLIVRKLRDIPARILKDVYTKTPVILFQWILFFLLTITHTLLGITALYNGVAITHSHVIIFMFISQFMSYILLGLLYFTHAGLTMVSSGDGNEMFLRLEIEQ